MKPTIFRVTFEDGETRSATLMPIMPAAYIATVAPKDAANPTKFSGAYGIDWCEMDGSFSKIETFQNTKTSAISHVLDEATSQFKTGGADAEKQALLKKMYEVVKYQGKDYPLTWINLPKGKVASVTIKAALISGTREKNDFLTIVKHPNFEISHDKTSDAGSNPAIKLEKIKNKGWDVDIKALNTFAQTEYIIIQDYKGDEVGKIEMAPNSVENLEVKIIPVVFKSNEAKEKGEAITLYDKAKKAKTVNLGNNLEETFNQYSFNQAGIKCNIEPVKANPERVVIDLTKKNWSNFYDAKKKKFQDWDFNATEPNASKRPAPWESEDGNKFYEYKDGKVANTKRLLLDELEEAYYDKHGKGYKGALIFVTEESYYKPDTLGYSQNNPLRSQGTIIFKGGLNKSDAYAHELGHMLGLEHVFLKTDEDEVNEIKDDIKREEKNITNFESDIQSRKELIENRKENIAIEIKRTKDNGYNDDGSVEDQDWVNEQEALINGFRREIDEYNNEIIDFEDKIEDFKRKIAIEKGSGFKIKKGTSNNFMDYDISRLYFNKFQCLVMREEIKSFYNG